MLRSILVAEGAAFPEPKNLRNIEEKSVNNRKLNRGSFKCGSRFLTKSTAFSNGLSLQSRGRSIEDKHRSDFMDQKLANSTKHSQNVSVVEHHSLVTNKSRGEEASVEANGQSRTVNNAGGEPVGLA
jgi:hypothetical protein